MRNKQENKKTGGGPKRNDQVVSKLQHAKVTQKTKKYQA